MVLNANFRLPLNIKVNMSLVITLIFVIALKILEQFYNHQNQIAHL